MVAHKLVDPRSGGNVNHYWLVKNLLAQALIPNHDLWKKAKEFITATKRNCDQVRENLTLMSQDMEREFPQQEALEVGEPFLHALSIDLGAF